MALACCSTLSPAQTASAYFHTVGNVDGSGKTADAPKEAPANCDSIAMESSVLEEIKARESHQSKENTTRQVRTQKMRPRTRSYRQWKERELNIANLLDVIGEVGLTNGLIVLAQALLETGHFSSRVCREYNNLFGLYDSKNKEYFRFARWEDSVVAYQRMIQYKYKGGNYFHFLKRIGYAEDPGYIVKLARTVKSVYKSSITR